MGGLRGGEQIKVVKHTVVYKVKVKAIQIIVVGEVETIPHTPRTENKDIIVKNMLVNMVFVVGLVGWASSRRTISEPLCIIPHVIVEIQCPAREEHATADYRGL